MANELRIGGAVVDFQGRNQQLLRTVRQNEAALKRQSRAVDQARRRFASLRSSVAGLAAPLLGVSAAFRAVSVNTRFESALAKIQGLVGVAKEDVNDFRDSLLELAGTAGRSPVELAEALFFITSAGARGSAALNVLNLSAKAAAAGLGETKVVADAATSAINAYGAENLTAERAVAVLLGTVREGKAEAETIAPVFGRVTGAAAALGIEFDELAAVIAALTRGGLNAAESTTALNAVLKAIAAPAERSKKEIDRLGLSVEGLQQIAREEGLVQYLTVLKTVANGNIDTIKKLVGEFRGVNAVLQLTGANLESYIDIANSLSSASVEDLTRAFEAQEDTLSQQYQRSLALIDSQLIRLGATTLPVVADALKLLNDYFALFVAIVGNIVLDKVIGQVAAMSAGLAVFIPRVNAATASISRFRVGIIGLNKALLAVGIGYLIWDHFNTSTTAATDSVKALDKQIEDTRKKIRDLQATASNPLTSIASFLTSGGDTLESLQKELDELIKKRRELAESLKKGSAAADDEDPFAAQRRSLEEFAERAKKILGDLDRKPVNVKVNTQIAEDSLSGIRQQLQNELRNVQQNIDSLSVDEESGARQRLLDINRTLNQVADERIQLQNRLNDAVEAGNDEEAAALRKSIALLAEDGAEVSELIALTESLTAARQRLNTITDEQNALQQRLQRTSNTLQYSFEGFFTQIITGAESASDALRNLARVIVNELARALIAQPIAAGLAGILQPTLAGIFGGAGAGAPAAGRGYAGTQSGVAAFAQGGLADGLSFVGEQGPELVDFRNPGRVYSNADLSQALGAGAGGIVVDFHPVIQSSDGPGVRKALYEVLPRFEENLRNSLRQDMKRPSAIRNALRGG